MASFWYAGSGVNSQMATPAMAELMGKMLYGSQYLIDDIKLDPKNANGNPAEASAYNGTTYLPVLGQEGAIGKTVQ